MTCIVEQCENTADFWSVCDFHRKREIEGRLVDLNGLVYDTCVNHHLWTPENTRYEASGSKGGKRRRCKECQRLKAQRKARETTVEVKAPAPYMPENEEMRKAVFVFERAITEVPPKCKTHEGAYRDYDAATMPTAEMAAAMCAGCPLLKLCDNYAHVMKPSWGIWGGKRWAYGRIYKGQEGLLHADD